MGKRYVRVGVPVGKKESTEVLGYFRDLPSQRRLLLGVPHQSNRLWQQELGFSAKERRGPQLPTRKIVAGNRCALPGRIDFDDLIRGNYTYSRTGLTHKIIQLAWRQTLVKRLSPIAKIPDEAWFVVTDRSGTG